MYFAYSQVATICIDFSRGQAAAGIQDFSAFLNGV